MMAANSQDVVATKTAVTLALGGWLLFRFVSDWPRGLLASGVGGVPAWAMSLSYIGLCVWLMAALPLALRVADVWSRVRRDPIVQSQLLFLGYQLVAAYFSIASFGADGVLASAYILLVSISFTIIYLLGVQLGKSWTVSDLDKWVRRSTRIVVWALAPTMLIGAAQLLTGTGRDVGDGIPRIYGGTSSPNALGAVLLVACAPIFVLSMEAKRSPWSAMLAVVLALFIACFSLAGLICFIGAAGFFWLLNARNHGRIPVKLNWLLSAAVAAALIALAAGEILVARFASLGESENSLVWRLRTWLEILDVLRDPQTLLFGGGLGFDHLGLEYPPHNEYLRILVETGAVGLTLFMLVWVRVYQGLRRLTLSWHPVLQRYSAALQSAALGLLVWAFADSVLRTAPSVILLWFLVGVAMGLGRSRIVL